MCSHAPGLNRSIRMAIQHALLHGDRQTASELAAVLDLMASRERNYVSPARPGQRVPIRSPCAPYCREPA